MTLVDLQSAHQRHHRRAADRAARARAHAGDGRGAVPQRGDRRLHDGVRVRGHGVQALGGASILLAGLGAVAAGAALSVIFYLWAFRAPARAPAGGQPGRGHRRRILRPLDAHALRRPRPYNVPTSPRRRAWNFGGVRALPTDLYVAAIALVVMALLFALLHLTPIGRQMRAISDNPDLARACGIRSGRVLLALWAAVGGALRAGRDDVRHQGGGQSRTGLGTADPGVRRDDPGRHRQPAGRGRRRRAAGHRLGTFGAVRRCKIAVAFALLLLVLLLRPRGLFGKAIAAR